LPRWSGRHPSIWRYCASVISISFLLTSQTKCQLVLTRPSPSIPIPPQSATVQVFRQEQAALSHEQQALEAQEASTQQLEAWQSQNAARFAAQQQRVQAMVTGTSSSSPSLDTEVRIPDGASQDLADFLITKADLFNRSAQLHNQLQVSASQGGVSGSQTGSLPSSGSNEVPLFQQQNAAELEAQAQRAQRITAQLGQTPVPAPAPLSIPPTVSSQIRTLLTLRDQLMRSEILIHNQYAMADPATRQAAMQNWELQNAAQINQAKQLAQSLVPTQ
jgi:hypothetical protein